MYSTLLVLHSFVRWLVLISLTLAVVNSYRGLLSRKRFSKTDNIIRLTALSMAHLQLVIGLLLYAVSPIVNYFLKNFNTALSTRELRFFGMEHIVMMLVAITLITVGSAATKRKLTDRAKFKTMVIWFSIALFIIIFSIPWHFLPISPHRPYFRLF